MDKKVQSEKKDYEPPRAMRLGEMRSGAGLCDTGSGDYDCDLEGNSATSLCDNGNNGPPI
jgi:hypothetical protein